MSKSEKQIAQAVQRFAKRWNGLGYKKGENAITISRQVRQNFQEPDIVAHLFTINNYLTHQHKNKYQVFDV